MNLRAWILGTVAANLVLVATLLWQAARLPAPGLHGGLAITTNVVAEYVIEQAPAPVTPKIPGSPPFHWSQMESTNYSVFATNLLAVGCPQETVRDILEARVADDFRTRVRELTRPVQLRFWEAAAADSKIDDLFKDTPLEAALEGLKTDKERALKELHSFLGSGKKASPADRNVLFGHLPEDKQRQLTALEDRHTQERDTFKRETANLAPAERSLKSKALVDRHQAERRAQLTDGEWDEAELRRSPQAAKVRELRGFTATPEELRSLARTLREFDTNVPRPARELNRPADDPAYQASLDEREAQRRQFLTERLGAAGFAMFERAGDPRFHTLLKLARRLDLPAANAGQWLEMQETAQAQASQVRQDRTLPGEARAVAVLALRAETERTLQNVIGARGWTAYQRHAGEWLRELEK